MTTQSNIPLPATIQKWREGSWVYYYNCKDNGIQPPDDFGNSQDGKRYTAEFVVFESKDRQSVVDALIRSRFDPETHKKIIDNIEIEGQPALKKVKVISVGTSVKSKFSKILDDYPLKDIDGTLITI